MFENSTILITGGTGSFGNQLTKELLKENIKELRILSRDEQKQCIMARKFPDKRLKFFLGDVRNYERVKEVSADCNIVFHAAALKIIPTCEVNTKETLEVNSLGTINVKNACIENKVRRAVFISTDKAVKPVNFYGMTKAIAERIWIEETLPNGTIFSVVRYGNVLNSRGSVIPYFKSLVQENKPFTITDIRMTRFLLSLREAIALVKYVSNFGKNGCIYVPDIQSAEITTIANAITTGEYPREIIGIRPGEKIHECLIQESEIPHTYVENACFVINPNYEGKTFLDKEFTSKNSGRMTTDELRKKLKDEGII
jgi:UDP-glucose 4-epimerase